jgi:Cu(I)/Ag(I) efflux system membrane fusion protein
MPRLLLALLLLALGIVIGVSATHWWSPAASDLKDAGNDPEILYWVAPMDPEFRRKEPGKSPMGMDLVPFYAGQRKQDGAQGVRINPAMVNNFGVVTALAERKVLTVTIRTVGRLEYNDERLAHVHLRTSGWIHRLAVRAEGERVKRGGLLFDVYSPDLVKAQAEYLQTLKSGRHELIGVTRDRLRALGIPQSQIDAVERDGKVHQYVHVYAPKNGVVVKLNVADGKFVKPDSDIMVIAELDELWLISDVFETQADLLKPGAKVIGHTAAASGGKIETRVDYVYPDLDAVTRTIPVRSVVNNKLLKLKPGMFMTVTIETPARAPTVVIPSVALIRTGFAERVIVAQGDGQFRPAAVQSGAEADGNIEIVEGLAAGERVVVSGQFLIDSESSFAGASLRLSAPSDVTKDPVGAHQSAHEAGAEAAAPNGSP